jgi:hypothetical protein
MKPLDDNSQEGDSYAQRIQSLHHVRQRSRPGGRRIIGAAFGKIISSLVNDILMPPIGLL